MALLTPATALAQSFGQDLRILVSPHTLQVGKTSEIVLTISGFTAGPGAPLRTGDVFEIYMDFRGGVLRTTPTVHLQGPGLINQLLTAEIDSNGILRLVYSGPGTTWSVTDSVQLILKLTSPVEIGTSIIVLRSPSDGRFGTEWKVLPVTVVSAVSEALAGLIGPQGPAGTDGAIGPQGPAGPQGPQGRTGAEGPRGESGSSGPAGSTGPAGATGPAGPAGPTGAAGPAGAAGAIGPVGPIGLTGPQGLQGAVGPIGPIGLTGPQGLQGAVGPIGPIGLTGPQGLQGLIGLTGPQGLQGTIGLTGPQGLQGAIGLTGPQGPQGLQGLIGLTGPQGPQGLQGVIGLTGPQGPAGTAGLAAYASVAHLATLLDATVVGGADITFSSNALLSGITHTAGTTTLVVPSAGAYEITYSVSLTAGIGSSFAIAINGTVNPLSVTNSLIATGQVSGRVILTLAAGDVVTCRNNSLIAVTMALAPANGAQLTLKKLN